MARIQTNMQDILARAYPNRKPSLVPSSELQTGDSSDKMLNNIKEATSNPTNTCITKR